MSRDELYKNPLSSVPDFEFNESVVAVFPDMIERSVPGYTTMLEGIGVLANHHVSEHEHCYDLGCSLGACTESILRSVGDRKLKITAIDSSNAMIRQARANVKDPRVEFIESDVCEIKVTNARFVVLNLVLQFIDPAKRLDLLRNLHTGLLDGGVLVLSEKVPSSKLFEEMHLEFKEARGYSALEIAQKRTALEAVMRLDSLETHLKNLERVGFTDVKVWFRYLNWISILAIK